MFYFRNISLIIWPTGIPTKFNSFSREYNFISGVVHAFLKSHSRKSFTFQLGQCLFQRFFFLELSNILTRLDLVTYSWKWEHLFFFSINAQLYYSLGNFFFSVVLGCPLFLFKVLLVFFLTSQNSRWCFWSFENSWQLRILNPSFVFSQHLK